MGIASSLNLNFLRPFNAKNADTAQHILNKKANAKLNYVSGIFSDALNGHWIVAEDGFLSKKIVLEGLDPLHELTLSYYLQNRFFARIYDLRFDFKVPQVRLKESTFELAYAGRTQISSAGFRATGGGKEDLELLNNLNSKLITERLLKLDFLDFRISYSNEAQAWLVSAESIIGSATWNLIPPMFQVIKPTFKECILMMELFQLVIDALIHEEKE